MKGGREREGREGGRGGEREGREREGERERERESCILLTQVSHPAPTLSRCTAPGGRSHSGPTLPLF